MMEKDSGAHDSINRKPHFVSLLTAHYYQIHYSILTMVPNTIDAEDILQNTIMYLWEHFEDFSPDTSFSAWAVAIAKFQVLTYRKKLQRSKVYFSEKAIELIAAEHTRLPTHTDERYEALRKCLKELPQRDLDFLKKRFVQDSSVQRIADEIGASINVIYKRISKLKNILFNCVQRTMAAQGA